MFPAGPFRLCETLRTEAARGYTARAQRQSTVSSRVEAITNTTSFEHLPCRPASSSAPRSSASAHPSQRAGHCSCFITRFQPSCAHCGVILVNDFNPVRRPPASVFFLSLNLVQSTPYFPSFTMPVRRQMYVDATSMNPNPSRSSSVLLNGRRSPIFKGV